MERSEVICKCRVCNRAWRKGEELDNETICLRCERLEYIRDMDQDERDYREVFGDD